MIIALAQLRSTADIAHNLHACQRLVRRAAERGAAWVLLPECAPYLGPDPRGDGAVQSRQGEIVEAFKALAAELNIWLTLGSFHERADQQERCYNTQLLFSPQGEIAASYRKIHLFDVTFDDGSSLRESDTFLAGDSLSLSTVQSGDGDHAWRVGHTICYDVRFPWLYQALLDQGAEALTVPSAFTLATGREHWHALLRARAIETQCYVLAPNQWGHHYGDRRSFGQSAIYDPWGRLLASAPEQECVISAELDISLLADVRARMPRQDHLRRDLAP